MKKLFFLWSWWGILWADSPEYKSQVGQDQFLNENYFRGRTDGVFVDVGAHDGITHSNTWFFEQLGWSGICVEPLPNAYEQLKKNRSCVCINACVSKDDVSSVKFFAVTGYAEMLSGMLKTYDIRHLARLKTEIKNNGGTYEIIDVPSRRLATLLREHAIKKVDYLSIDTEGSELEVIQSIDFDECYIVMISIENNYNGAQVRTYLESKGFSYVTLLNNQDEIYINMARRRE